MSDSDEVADGTELVLEEAEKLAQVKKDHELLRYLDLRDDQLFAEFAQRFGKPGVALEDCHGYHWSAYATAKYFVALREANKDPTKEIVVTHGSPDSEYALR